MGKHGDAEAPDPGPDAGGAAYEMVFRHAGDAMFLADTTGRYLDVNQRGCELLGYPREELVRLRLEDLLSADDLQREPPRMDLLRAGHTLVRERRLRRRDGTLLRVEITAHALPDGRLLGTVRDVEERRRLEERLAASEELHRKIVEASPDGIAVADLEGVLTMVSPGALAMLGHEQASEMLGRRFLEFVEPASRDEAMGHALDLMRGGRPAAFEVRMLRRDGTAIPCEGRSALILGPGGDPQAMVLLARDISERRRAEGQLRASAERYRLLFEANPQPMWVYDLETLAFLAVNDAAIGRYGYTREEFLGMTIADIRPSEDVPRLIADVRAVTEGRHEAGLWRHRRKGGTIIDVEITSHVLRFDGRRAELVHAHDVTERLRSEARVRQITRLYALLSQVNQAIVRIGDRDRLFAELCRVAVDHGGFRMAWIGWIDAETAEVRPLVHAGHEDGYLDAVRISSAEQPAGQGPTGTAARAGALKTCEDIATDPRMEPWRDEALRRGYRSSAAVPLRVHGAVVGLLNLYSATPASFGQEDRALLEEIGEDVSFALEAMEADRRRREAERALRTSEARLGHMLAASPITVYTLDVVDDQLVPGWVSENIRTTMGYGPDAPRGGDWWRERVHPDDRERVLVGIPRLFVEGHLRHEYRFRCADGTYRWILDELRVLRDESGQPREVIGAWTDVTWRRQAEEERLELERRLLHSQKLESLGVLAGGIAHDFNNLLTGIIGHLDLAARQLPEGEEPAHHLQQAGRAADLAVELTRQMLAYSGRGSFVIESLDLNGLVRDNVQILRASVLRNVELELALAPALPPVDADAGQLQQVVMNLVTNAADAIGERAGRIHLSTGVRACHTAELRDNRTQVPLEPGEYVFLEVVDDGSGMDDGTLARLFDPFFTTKATGRGLGMSAILGIMRSHRGAILVNSAPGRGTTFRLLFPVGGQAPAPVREVAPAAGAAAALSGTVLLVDDEQLIREVASAILRHLGLEVVTARDGAEALALFRRRAGRFDWVLLDLSMPHMDGLAAMAELLRIRPDVRIILSSGYDEQDALRRDRGLSPAAFVQKPYSIDRLREVLERTRGTLPS
jgi:PAS domain S-box-containing protein